ncbi:MAG TPA: hypothetical protein VFY23_14600 [Candidatus Limnocylindrales bacterium]|nr:hypothetical protein [Candidatus Limnocylindrales bacterium]
MQHSTRRLVGLIATGGLVLAALATPTAAVASAPTPTPPEAVCQDAGSTPDPCADPGVDPTPDPTGGQPGDEEPADDGEIVYDREFVTPTPAAAPVGAVLGATSRPVMTPPATDTIGEGPVAPAGTVIQAILLVLAGLFTMVPVLARTPAARRRRSRDGGA